MASNLVLRLFALGTLLYCSEAINCTIPPLVLTIENNTLSADGIALNRGIGLSIGGQTQGLRLNFDRNNTGIRNAHDCDYNTTAKTSQCRGASGGVFSIEDSQSFIAVTSQDWKVPAPDALPNGAHVVRGYDKATFRSGVTDPNFPFEVWSDTKATNRSALGMGMNSSVLSSFVGSGVAPSPEFGLYFGSRSIDHPDNGELVIGGYNSGRVKGKFKDFPVGMEYGIPESCPMQLLLKDILVTDINGTARSILSDGSSRIPACINPSENAFTFTMTMYEKWANLTRHPTNPPVDGSKNFTDQTYLLSSEPYMQELIVVIEGGYNSTIPHYELVTFERGNDAQGLYAVTNTSRLASAITVGDSFTFPVLGGVFLSQNYLRVDYNRKVFSLAPAVTGPLEENQSNITSTCNAPPPIQTGTPIPPRRKLSAGAIAGVVVGSITGAIVLLGLVVLFFRRWRSALPSAQEPNGFGAYSSPDTVKTEPISSVTAISPTGSLPPGTILQDTRQSFNAQSASPGEAPFTQPVFYNSSMPPAELYAPVAVVELPGPTGAAAYR